MFGRGRGWQLVFCPQPVFCVSPSGSPCSARSSCSAYRIGGSSCSACSSCSALVGSSCSALRSPQLVFCAFLPYGFVRFRPTQPTQSPPPLVACRCHSQSRAANASADLGSLTSTQRRLVLVLAIQPRTFKSRARQRLGRRARQRLGREARQRLGRAARQRLGRPATYTHARTTYATHPAPRSRSASGHNLPGFSPVCTAKTCGSITGPLAHTGMSTDTTRRDISRHPAETKPACRPHPPQDQDQGRVRSRQDELFVREAARHTKAVPANAEAVASPFRVPFPHSATSPPHHLIQHTTHYYPQTPRAGASPSTTDVKEHVYRHLEPKYADTHSQRYPDRLIPPKRNTCGGEEMAKDETRAADLVVDSLGIVCSDCGVRRLTGLAV